jgi:CRP/FNR family transcriptional regulator
MSNAPYIESLIKQKFPVLHEESLIKEIAENGNLVSHKAGDIVLEINHYIKSIFLLVDGSVKIIREDDEGNELFLYYLNGAQTCAMALTCCLNDMKSHIRAIAEEDCTIITVPIKFLDSWMDKYNSWKAFVFQTYNIRFNELLSTIDSIAFMKMDERLYKYLVDKVRATGKKALRVTHQEIAYELNTSREVISRLLKQLEKHDKIALSRNRIDFLDPVL